MKKRFGLFLLSLTCATAAVAAVACAKNEEGSNGSYTVSFVDGEGFDYKLVNNESESPSSIVVKEGDALSFTLDIGAFYAGTPTVLANNVAVASADGVYTVTVKQNTQISVNGITEDVSNMVGTGAHDDAFLVTRPIDLLYIAEQVNAGNQTYATAAYVLGNDIDCKGEELEVIGDLSTDQSFFSGVFSCYTDSETGAMERYTISNFVINSDDSSYVGLFGCVQTNLTTTSSGMFYGIRLDNFTINASTSGMREEAEQVMYCGSLIGYGVGANAYLCEATNGTLNVFADDNYFAFAGGLIGCQQGYYEQAYGLQSVSEITYATVDVDVLTVKGVTLYAGGIVGYAFTNSLVAPAYIHNSYSTGTVSGALRAGGIAGGLSQYTSIAACYTTGDVIASAGISTTDEYCKAYAGGIVGHAENDTIVNDCFALGDVAATAKTGAHYAFTNDFVGGGDQSAAVGVNSVQYTVLNCLNALPTDYSALGFYDHDWVLPQEGEENHAPAINYESSAAEVSTTLNVYFVTKDENVTLTVSGVNKTDYTVTNAYEPIVDAFNSGYLPVYMTATATGTGVASGAKYLSYGYFFDRECTNPVPYSFVTTKSIDLYVGFADYTPVVGTYYIENEDASFTLTDSGMIEYLDGTVAVNTRYQYDGKNILIEGATFAKYYDGEVNSELSVNADTEFDMNRYTYLNFEAAVQQDGSLRLYDGVYFTKDAPLKALTSASGTGTPIPAANHEVSWYDLSTGTKLSLFADGTATAEYESGYSYDLIYEASRTNGYGCLYYVQEQESNGVNYTYKTVFGYFKHDANNNALVATMLDPNGTDGSYAAYNLLVVDDFDGYWVADNEIFGYIRFNGLGQHASSGYGLLQIGDADEPVVYQLTSDFVGKFTYNGVQYEIVFNEALGTAQIVKPDSAVVQLQRPDEFAEYTDFAAFNGSSFELLEGFRFDGKGLLENGGALTMPNGEVYAYKYQSQGSYLVYDQYFTELGSIVKQEEGYYELSVGATSYDLYPTHALMGTWAMSGQFDSLDIGPMNLDGEVFGRFKGVTVTMEYLDPTVLSFSTKVQNMPVTYYLFLLTDDEGNTTGIAMSEYTSLAYNQYTICSKADSYFGEWTQADGKFTMSFDGVAFDPSGRYSYGQAYISYDGKPTPYYYIFTANENDNYIFEEGEYKVLMWSQSPLMERTIYYTLVSCDPTDEGAYTMVKDGVTYAFKRVEVDSLFESSATDDKGVVYTFDGGNVGGKEGTVTASNGKTYSYKITEYQTNAVVITFTDKSTGKTYTATLDTTDAANIKITLA
ncbi:MAG: hypothetical protein IJ514_00465 [Clostridia bacterium]|nr:hypothetical protein [Clostridia bacterium]